jgi:hypothetical protein
MFEDSSAAKADKAVPITITSANVIDFILSNRPSAGDWPQLERQRSSLPNTVSGRDVTYGGEGVFLAAGGFGSRFRDEQIFGDLIAKSVLSLLSDVVPSEEIFSDMRGCCRLQFYQVCLARGEHESAAVAETKVPRRHSSVISRGEIPRLD